MKKNFPEFVMRKKYYVISNFLHKIIFTRESKFFWQSDCLVSAVCE